MHNLWKEKRGKFPWDLHTSKKGRLIERFHMTSRRPYWSYKNNQTAAMLVLQTNPVGVELFSYVNTFFCSHKFA